MSKDLKKDILKYQKELTPSPKKPTPKTRKRCPNGTRKNKKTGNCDPIGLKLRKPSPKKPKTPSPKKSTLKTRKRCPKGTRKNKKTGNCDPKDMEKTQSFPKPKTPNPVKPKTPSPKKPNYDAAILKVRDLLYNLISDATREVDYHGNKYFTTGSGILVKDKFKDAQLALRDLVKLTKQEEEYIELIGHTLEYHVKKNLQDVKETPESIYKKAQSMIQEAIKDPKKADNAAFGKTFNELRKKLKSIPKKDSLAKYEELAKHTLKFYLKGKRKTLKKKTVSIPDTEAGDKFKKLNKVIDKQIKFTNYKKWYVCKPDKEAIEQYDKVRKELNSMYKDKKNPVFVKKYKPLSSVSLETYLDNIKNVMYAFKRMNELMEKGIAEYPRPTPPDWKKIYERYREAINKQFTEEEPIFLKIFYPITQFTYEDSIKNKLPPERSSECDMMTICQYEGSCWFVTVFMMLAKIKPLYNLLKPEHQTFVDGLLLCQRNDMGSYCKLPPPDIWKLYREKHRKYKSLHELYDSKESIKLDELFEKGGYSFMLFKAVMQLNKIYYLSDFDELNFGDSIVNHINSLLNSKKNACEWLLANYKKGKGKTDYLNDVLMKHGGLKYRYDLREIIEKEEPWPTDDSIKKGICYRTTISFLRNNRVYADPQKMGVPELTGVPHRKKWNLERNWLSEVAKENPNFVGGWFNLKYPKKVKIGGVTHSVHTTGFSVCRDDPKNPTINICNTWGGTCSQGKHNPWGPDWESNKIILDKLQIIQYFPPI